MEIIAHRGASHDAPENTLAATRLAWEQGADALELDVHLTRDGELAVIHDEDLFRVAGDRRKVADSNFAELAALDVGRWKNPGFAGEKIPALREVLALIPSDKRVFIEIKGGPEVVSALTRAIGVSAVHHDQIVIISFDRFAAQAAKQGLPACEAAWIIDDLASMGGIGLDEILRTARGLGLDALDFERGWPLDERFVQQIHAQRFKVYVWTVDDAGEARGLERAGLDGITTNRPGWLRAQLGR